MNDNLEVDFAFTDAALTSLQGGSHQYSLSLPPGMPFPISGDSVEVSISGTLHLFFVKRRKIGWHTGNTRIQLLLDVSE